MPADFRAFGADHLAALAATAAVSLGLIAFGRRRGAGTRVVDRVLAVVILGAQVADPLVAHAIGRLNWRQSLPVELCDLASFTAVVALWTRNRFAFELTWFWGLSGTLQALLTPAVAFGWPSPEFVRFFVLHGGIVAAALWLGPGTGMVPRAGSVLRTLLATLGAGGAVALLDVLLGANYWFLCFKPPGSLLDWLGPWPVYVVAALGLGVGLWWLLDLPWRRARAGER